jgi:hypothetical protein
VVHIVTSETKQLNITEHNWGHTNEFRNVFLLVGQSGNNYVEILFTLSVNVPPPTDIGRHQAKQIANYTVDDKNIISELCVWFKQKSTIHNKYLEEL